MKEGGRAVCRCRVLLFVNVVPDRTLNSMKWRYVSFVSTRPSSSFSVMTSGTLGLISGSTDMSEEHLVLGQETVRQSSLSMNDISVALRYCSKSLADNTDWITPVDSSCAQEAAPAAAPPLTEAGVKGHLMPTAAFWPTSVLRCCDRHDRQNSWLHSRVTDLSRAEWQSPQTNWKLEGDMAEGEGEEDAAEGDTAEADAEAEEEEEEEEEVRASAEEDGICRLLLFSLLLLLLLPPTLKTLSCMPSSSTPAAEGEADAEASDSTVAPCLSCSLFMSSLSVFWVCLPLLFMAARRMFMSELSTASSLVEDAHTWSTALLSATSDEWRSHFFFLRLAEGSTGDADGSRSGSRSSGRSWLSSLPLSSVSLLLPSSPPPSPLRLTLISLPSPSSLMPPSSAAMSNGFAAAAAAAGVELRALEEDAAAEEEEEDAGAGAAADPRPPVSSLASAWPSVLMLEEEEDEAEVEECSAIADCE